MPELYLEEHLKNIGTIWWISVVGESGRLPMTQSLIFLALIGGHFKQRGRPTQHFFPVSVQTGEAERYKMSLRHDSLQFSEEKCTGLKPRRTLKTICNCITPFLSTPFHLLLDTWLELKSLCPFYQDVIFLATNLP